MIGSVGPETPRALLEASGRYAGPLGWNIDRAFPLAAQWLENKFPLWAFSILEDWAAGEFDHLDTVVFSRADDSAQRLYYYVCELRARGLIAGPEPLLFDVAKTDRASSEARNTEAISKLAEGLGVDVQELTEMQPSPVRPAVCGKVCLLAGTLPPDHRLHAMVDATGWHADGPTLGETWQGLDPSLGGSRGFHDRGAALAKRVAETGAQAVVLWFAEEDEAEVWHLPAQRRAMAAIGVPMLELTRRSWRADDGVGEEIGRFLNSQNPSC